MTHFGNLVNRLLEQIGGLSLQMRLVYSSSLERFTLMCITWGRVCKGGGHVQGYDHALVLASKYPDVPC